MRRAGLGADAHGGSGGQQQENRQQAGSQEQVTAYHQKEPGIARMQARGKTQPGTYRHDRPQSSQSLRDDGGPGGAGNAEGGNRSETEDQ